VVNLCTVSLVRLNLQVHILVADDGVIARFVRLRGGVTSQVISVFYCALSVAGHAEYEYSYLALPRPGHSRCC
jgi:hypothetical protein